MSRAVSYRLYAMEIASLAQKIADPDLAAHCRRLATSYMALARFHERASRYDIARSNDPPGSDARVH